MVLAPGPHADLSGGSLVFAPTSLTEVAGNAEQSRWGSCDETGPGT